MLSANLDIVKLDLDSDKMVKPSPRKRSTYHHGDLRLALLSAAEQEIEEKGIEGFSLRGVAKRAGVSHAAPLHHFPDTRVLLTSLAARGFQSLLAVQKARRAKAQADALSQLVASGMGYVDFALAHPALFRLMFSSDRPDHETPELMATSTAAYEQLVTDVKRVHALGRVSDEDELIVEATKAWALAHGLADLLASGRLKFLLALKKPSRDKVIEGLLRQSLGSDEIR